ncbi:MAG: hypothetical protein J6Q47_02325, partial [Paludibacteraceae bacterium]|nr:hypothetical protein [Paludibacteraceae bacterium]
PRSLRLSANHLRNRNQYDWERDYPLSLQERNPNGFSSIELDFELNPSDISAIRGLTGIRLSGHIPVRVSINHSTVKIDIPKRGTPAFANTENKLKIIEYVCFKIDFNFIPAVRTEHDALRVVDSLIEKQLSALESNPEYVEAIFGKGLNLYNRAVEADNKASEIQDYKLYQQERQKVDKMIMAALPYFEKVLELKPEDDVNLRTLKGIYYRFSSKDKEFERKYNDMDKRMKELGY